MANLANKYRPARFEDVTEQSVVIDILSKMCKADKLENRNFLLIGPAGTGKAQPLYSKVLTLTGYKPMGSIRVGDAVLTHTNSIARIENIYPQGERDIYEITLCDNSSFRVADNHINVVEDKDEKLVNYTTLELIDLFNKGTQLTIPSFVLDGHEIQDIPNIEVYAEAIANIIYRKYCKYDNLVQIDDLEIDGKLERKLLYKDRLTDRVLMSPLATRQKILSAMKHLCKMNYKCDEKIIKLSNIDNKNIIESLVELANSCGYYTNVMKNNNTYTLTILSGSKNDRRIIDIKYIGKERCQCIYLDHPDHTYITDNYTVTHNTTTARILDNVLNEGLGQPIELDAASNGGIDNVRQIIEQARSYPVGYKYKVFILDEVHAFSNSAWQALLKTLESNPAKSIFVLCTTNPEKIPATILSRVQTFQLSKISLDGIVSRLKYVLDQEIKDGRDIEYEDSAISFIAKLAKGGMRDSLTLLDKVLAYDTNVTDENIAKALNLPHYDDFFDLLRAYSKKDNVKVTEIIAKVYDSGVNFVKWFDDFHSFVINVVKYIFIKDIKQTMIPVYYEDKISAYSTPHSVVCLQLANKLLELNQKLKTTQYLEEIALTYLCTPERRQ